ncbi:hypothetical protein DACRYDRAFT_117908 [Dacryopinax primogenitus]|uniref:F-box domain-containing protein n=1 Tax=Dacryopinax primogenitus (strain DJM 731) TaxID=1858805 RepID=M5FVU8_DACPD|nr:uncharacterized protein DACRYDRAFT_117908 [Dacryopinax primogenitus]EJT99729.1 hypothetical protein DACRYDRAFT_117908 [Dacryopinax primogenitus]
MSPCQSPCKLPFDVLEQIIPLVTDPHTLIQLCLVSPMMGELAAKQLYKSILLDNVLTIIKLHRTLAGNTFLSSQVSSLTLDIRVTFEENRRAPRQVMERAGGQLTQRDICGKWVMQAPAYLRLLFRTIGQMRNLRKIATIEFIGFAEVSTAFFACLCHLRPGLFSLKFDSILPCEINLNDLLSSQPRLEELEFIIYHDRIHDSRYLGQITANSAPGLRRIACESYLVSSIVPGRPIEEFGRF